MSPFGDGSARSLPWRFQTQLSGGGILSWDGSYIKWTSPFRVDGLGSNHHLIEGSSYYAVPTLDLAGNQTIFVANPTDAEFTAGTNQIVAAPQGIPFLTSDTLYWIPPFGWDTTSIRGGACTLAIVKGASIASRQNFIVPPHWIRIAQGNSVDGRIYWGNGSVSDNWRNLSGSYAATFGVASPASSVRDPQVYKDGQGNVHFEGVFNSTAANAGLVNIGKTIPAGYRPGAGVFAQLPVGVGAGTGLAKMLVSTAGAVTVTNTVAGNVYASMTWLAEN